MHKKITAAITAVGGYVPEEKLTNADLEKMVDTNDEWIRTRTGVSERRILKGGLATSDMVVPAVNLLLQKRGISAEEIDCLIVGTVTPDMVFPATANIACHKLGAKNAWGFDVSAACSGFLYTLSIGAMMIESGRYKKVVVCGADKMSAIVDYTDRATCILFGDGAGAVVLQPTDDENRGILSTHLHSDGEAAEILAMYNPGTHANHWVPEKLADFDNAEIGEMFFSHSMIDKAQVFPNMDGQSVFKKAVVKFPEVIKEALSANNFQTSDLRLLIPHQANLRISQFVQQKLGLRDDQVKNNIQKYGNTTAASIPIALCEAWEEGQIQEGDLVCLASFGSGFTWASALLKW